MFSHYFVPLCAMTLGCSLLFSGAAHGQRSLSGSALASGAKAQVGTSHYGEEVNVVYAADSGASTMQGELNLPRLESGPLYLHLKGRDDDSADTTPVAITVNGEVLFEGPNPFPNDDFAVVPFSLPEGLARVGANRVVIENKSPEGRVGMPPWFMVAAVGIGPEGYQPGRDIRDNFVVQLPDELRPYPEPLPEGVEPGFSIRGTKGWNWTPEQYLAEIPILAEYNMNFLMNCYLSMFSQDPLENRWWEPLPDELKEAYTEVVRSAEEHDVNFCFAIHPQLWSPRPMDPTSDEDFEALWQHFEWAQSIGVQWFSLPLDDIHVMEDMHISGPEHAAVVNKLFERLRENDPEAQFIFCPTWYGGDGSGEVEREYLEALAELMHPEVYLFWTGDGVVGNITREGAETYRGFAKLRIVLWDNYPVNDAHQAMHLGPVTDREPDLHEVLDGYMSNPHASQSEINRIPLLTCADYAWNPEAYDPARSIGQAIAHLEPEREAQEVLRDLVEAYPGMLLHDTHSTGLNSVRQQYTRISNMKHARFAAEAFLNNLKMLHDRMERVFPDRYVAARETLKIDIDWVQAQFDSKYSR